MKIITTDYSMQTRSYDIFFSGCSASPRCVGCHNPEAWDFSLGHDWKLSKDKIAKDLEDFRPLIDWVFVLGGDPMDQNKDDFQEFLDFMHTLQVPLVLFTRYELNEIPEEIVQQFDYIKTGRFLPELSCTGNTWYGVSLATSNQRIWKKGINY